MSLTSKKIPWETGAVKEAQAGLALSSTNPRSLGEAGYVLARTGHAVEARSLLRTLNGIALRGSGQPIYLAMVYVGLNEPQQALDQLQLQARTFGGLEGIGQWHAFDELGHDPRNQEAIAAGRVATKSVSQAVGPIARH